MGEPLARPSRELPFLGRGLFIVMTGGILLLSLLVSTLVTLIQRPPAHFGFWTVVGSAEYAVWQLKWVAIPLSLLALWFSRKVWLGIRREPTRFVGGSLVNLGLGATAFSAFAFVTLIGVTVPDRIHSYRLSVDAEQFARAYTYDRILLEYRARFGTLPTVPSDLRKLPDPNGEIADLLKANSQATYRPWTELATVNPRNIKGPRSGSPRIRPASLSGSDADTPSGETVSFTSYELRTPGADGIYGTDDDLIIRDGIVEKAGNVTGTERNGLADRNKLP